MVKVVVSEPKTGMAYQLEVEESRKDRLRGIDIGDTFDGEILDLPGFKLKVTGGTDQDGFPMRFDLKGPTRARVLLARGPGFRPSRNGERRRKLVRGNSVTRDITQLNVKVVEQGKKSIEEILSSEPVEDSTS